MNQPDTIIIGAGVSGLATAYYLKKLGQKVVVLESTSRPGGVLKRAVVEGYQLELGPNSFLLRDEHRPFLEELKLDILQASKSASARFLYLESKSGYQLYKAPSSMVEVLTTGIISAFGKLRVPFEQIVGRIRDDLSVHDFLVKRFGAGVARIGETVLNGIYAADTSKLSARSALPKLRELQSTYGSVIGGFLFQKKKKAKGKLEIVTFRRGMEELPEKLALSLKEELRFNSAVREILPAAGVKLDSGEILQAKNIVISSDALSASRMIKNLFPILSDQIEGIPYVPLGILYVIGEKADLQAPIDGFGFLKQPKKGNSVLGALYSSSLFPLATSAVGNQVLMTCFIGGGLNPELSDVTKDENARRAFVELKEALGLGESFKILHVHYWERAFPSYPVGHHRLLEQVLQLEKERIFVASNWLERPGLPDCIIRGKEIAQRIVT